MPICVSPRTFIGLAVVLIGMGGVVGGCDTSFDPFVENEQDYSIVGYLDTRKDTQFVRVERLRDSLLFETKPLPATVTLEHVRTGQTRAWRDSIFRLALGKRAHNFWSTGPIRPRATYRFSVQGPDGRKSTATVALPDTFPDPQILTAPSCLNPNPRAMCGGDFFVDITGIETLAAVQAVYRHKTRDSPSQKCQGRTMIDHLEGVQPIEEGVRVQIDWREDLKKVEGVVVDVELLVAAGGPSWPKAAQVADVEEQALFLPGNYSNVEGGVGFLGGVVSKVVDIFPPQDCGGNA